MKRLTFAVFFIVTTLAFNALALEVPPKPLGRVSDYTNTLSTSEIGELEQVLEQFERDTTNQIAVVLIPTLAGDNLEDYSIRLAQRWKIGQEGKDNGVILLIVKQDRKIRIEVGYGLEGHLPDSLAGEIIREKMAPYFRQNHFFDGISSGVSEVIKVTKGEYQQRYPESEEYGGFSPFHPMLIKIYILLLVAGIGFAIIATKYSHVLDSIARVAGPVIMPTNGGFGGGFGGSGSFSGGGGGFGGGGGGFGGGGASGGW